LIFLAAARNSREQMDAKLKSLCASQVPGDTHRNLQVLRILGQTFKHIRCRSGCWLRLRPRAFQVVINGTPEPSRADIRRSWIKIILAVLAGLAAAV